MENNTVDVCNTIIFTASVLQEKIKIFLLPYDVTHQQFKVLCLLQNNKEAMSTINLRDKMMDKMSDTSRIVDRLVAKKMVVKKSHNIDKRKVEVTITEAGIKLLTVINKNAPKLDDILKKITKAELKNLYTLLDKITAH